MRLIVNSDEPTGRLALVFELMDMNLYESIKGKQYEFMIKVVRRTYLNRGSEAIYTS